MPTYAEYALQHLRHHGLRVTQPRRLVVELLDSSQRPLSAYEIRDALGARGEKIDIVSVYRILECLEAHHLLHRVLTSGKVRKCQLEHESHCSLTQAEHCHHLLICDACQAVEEIHCPGTATLVTALAAQTGFRIEGHNLEFTGRCIDCQAAAGN